MSPDITPDRTETQAPAGGFDRRTLLRAGGITLALGPIIAACGGASLGPESIGRVGVAEPRPELEDAPVNDVVLLRTAMSIEYTALEVYAAAAATGALSADQIRLIDAMSSDHEEHIEALAGLISAAGGQPFRCSNPFIMARVVEPILIALDDSADTSGDLIRIAHSLETLAASTYQLFVTLLVDPELRVSALEIGADEARHTAAVAIAASSPPESLLSPVLFGNELEPGPDGLPVLFAVPSRFGEVSANELVLSAPDPEGGQFSINIQTPAENSYVYEYMQC